MCFVGKINAVFNPLRQYFDIFDEVKFTKGEWEVQDNCDRLRVFIKAMIDKRRLEL